ncbi:hypothetical protein NW110_11055 [Staphylococcus pettenkoferi]|uniref:hypothetical protein n=1 Tax=Staphylococcus pettenkoferi TaxID=170573 RepID=UPI0011A6125F|nr:hypothetical protein [Staphylococcus pettenkoferi]MCY1591134.1 hypothetical protein [Staphylococcus pettenkoferi]MCY1600608.1 hypothetical protein [Staphylococcus pettenkoferi]MCY1602819.1 hypothetical protein [Staphylococcus pettenkoferi]MCY1609829.1 hypothetical protein [Staphylococcus pettenkoferi]MCY1614235.1 hypothetical protein [Staphylococcus pettenkoferi]
MLSIYIIFIILYFIVPKEINNRFLFLGLIVIAVFSQVASAFMFLMYGQYKYDIDHGMDPNDDDYFIKEEE